MTNIEHNDQKKKDKMTNIGQQIITQQTENRATQTSF